jgi:hypothetical protein
MFNSFKDSPYALVLGTSGGHLYAVGKGFTTISATALLDPLGTGSTFHVDGYFTAMTAWNNAEYYGVGHGSAGAEVWRLPSTDFTRYFDATCHYIVDFAVWNGRLWFIAVMKNRETKLFVTDGNTTSEAYKWKNHFWARALYAHWGSLYIAGGMSSYDETEDIGQVWRYGGSTMDLIAQFDDTGLSDNPTWSPVSGNSSNRVDALGSFGKFLAVTMADRTMFDGTLKRGVWFYNPEEDAWHMGATITSDATTFPVSGNYAGSRTSFTDMQEFDGALFFGGENMAGKLMYLRNDKTSYDKSFYRSSVFDGNVPNEDKVFSRVVLDMELGPNAQVLLEYSTDAGSTWTTATTFQNLTVGTIRQEYASNIGPSGAGVVGKSFQFRCTLYPGGGAVGAASASTPTHVYCTTVEYADARAPLFQWSFNVLCGKGSTGPDGTVDTRDGQDIVSDMEALRDDQLVHTFTDVDEAQYAVKVTNVQVYRQVITQDDVDGLQAELSVTLTQQR